MYNNSTKKEFESYYSLWIMHQTFLQSLTTSGLFPIIHALVPTLSDITQYFRNTPPEAIPPTNNISFEQLSPFSTPPTSIGSTHLTSSLSSIPASFVPTYSFSKYLSMFTSSSPLTTHNIPLFTSIPLQKELSALNNTQQFAENLLKMAQESQRQLAEFNSDSAQSSTSDITNPVEIQKTQRMIWLLFYLNQPLLRQKFSEL